MTGVINRLPKKVRDNIGFYAALMSLGTLLLIIIESLSGDITWPNAGFYVGVIVICSFLCSIFKPTKEEDEAFRQSLEARIKEYEKEESSPIQEALPSGKVVIAVIMIILLLAALAAKFASTPW